MDDVVGGNTAAPASPAGEASPASQPQSSVETAAPAAQGTQDSGITDHTEREGYIPRARFDEVNTRMTKAEQQYAQFREQYGWAESVDRSQLEQMASWYSRYNGDAGEFIENTLQEALAHPVHGQSVRSRIGRMLSSMRQQAQAEPEPIPDIPIVNERNEPVGNLAEIVQRLLAKEVGPLKQDLESRQSEKQQAQQRAQVRQQAEAVADADVAYVQKRPFFKDHKAEIVEVFKAHPSMTLREAADYVLDTKVLPGYGQKAQAQVLSDLQQKAHAQTVSPGMPSGSQRPKFKNFEEAATYYEQHPEEAAAMAQR